MNRPKSESVLLTCLPARRVRCNERLKLAFHGLHRLFARYLNLSLTSLVKGRTLPVKLLLALNDRASPVSRLVAQRGDVAERRSKG